ncbi:MAG: aspartate--ammonia ligase [Clostridiales bacterium]|nr:aspartate--ammonia ligase [Clostridiales bacterium]
MTNCYIPQGYKSTLDVRETETAIKFVKDTFERTLAKAMQLLRISAPLFVTRASGLNDNLSGVERPVSFSVRDMDGEVEIVHSLAKWKRMALKQYGFLPHEGLYTDMNAIRRDEEADNLHSIYVDQWDWEKVILPEDRTLEYLQNTVKVIVRVLAATELAATAMYPQLTPCICPDVYFITTQELENMYPNLSPKQRENEIARKYRTVFLMQIGDKLKSGKPHDGRAPDYDDWSLNGDIILWNELLGCAFEISSMGIRVDEEALARQLKLAGCEERAELDFHRRLLAGELPLTIGGGIGQSRLCMLMLQKCHIGEVQVSLWPEETRRICEENGVFLL